MWGRDGKLRENKYSSTDSLAKRLRDGSQRRPGVQPKATYSDYLSVLVFKLEGHREGYVCERWL